VDDREWVRHRESLVRLAGLLTGDAGRAEDLAAEAVARFLAAARRRRIDDPGAYMRRIVVNQVIGSWRKRRTEERLGHRVATSRSVDDESYRIGESERVWRAMLDLPARQRAALVLRFYEDRSVAETAALLGVPVGTVKSTVARGLERLHRELGDDRERDCDG